MRWIEWCPMARTQRRCSSASGDSELRGRPPRSPEHHDCGHSESPEPVSPRTRVTRTNGAVWVWASRVRQPGPRPSAGPSLILGLVRPSPCTRPRTWLEAHSVAQRLHHRLHPGAASDDGGAAHPSPRPDRIPGATGWASRPCARRRAYASPSLKSKLVAHVTLQSLAPA
jgi:hypothetical protein